MNTHSTRQQLIEAAYELFLEGSFHSVGIEAICKRANLSKGSLYHFFPSKNDVLFATLEYYTDEIERVFQERLRNIPTTEERINEFFQLAKLKHQRHNKHDFQTGCFIANVLAESSVSDGQIQSKAKAAMDRIAEIFIPTVANFLKEHQLGTADSKKVAELLLGLLQGATIMAKTENDPDVFDRYAPLAINFVLDAARININTKKVA